MKTTYWRSLTVKALIAVTLIGSGCGREQVAMDDEGTKNYRGVFSISSNAGNSLGIWMSQSEILALPMSGTGWSHVLNAANSSWGSANLSDNNSNHDIKTLAGALVAVRKGDSAMADKTIAGLQSAMKSGLSRTLELSRGLQTYVIAADIIGYRDAGFQTWVRKMLNAQIQGHSGGTGVIGTALKSANNWGGHARASAIASALYLKDDTLLSQMVMVYNEFIGVAVSKRTLNFTDTNWHADPANKAGVNRLGAKRNGINIDGAIPEDMRRGGSLSATPTYTGYGWEAMQGFVVSGVLLHRAGKVSITSGSSATRRAFEYLYRINWPATGDDTWLPYLANHYMGTSLPVKASSGGKNMDYTDWTHAH